MIRCDMANFIFWAVCSPTVGETSCCITIDATDPNIAAIRGLASGPAGLARLGFTASQRGCLCRWLPPFALHTSVHCYHYEMICLERTAGIMSSPAVTLHWHAASSQHLTVALLCGTNRGTVWLHSMCLHFYRSRVTVDSFCGHVLYLFVDNKSNVCSEGAKGVVTRDRLPNYHFNR